VEIFITIFYLEEDSVKATTPKRYFDLVRTEFDMWHFSDDINNTFTTPLQVFKLKSKNIYNNNNNKIINKIK
jgi:hypothetical protein